MAYTTQTWADYNSSYPLSAARLKHIEDGLDFVANGGAYISPEDYQAVGDGVTDDTAALVSTFAAGKNIKFKPGKTYLHRVQLTLNANQVLDGNGATLKRRAQATTTTTTSIASGVTTAITVASTSGFAVGDQISVEQGGVFDGTARYITSIVGNVITTTTAWAVTFSGTTNVRHAWCQLAVGAANVRITNLVLDGNSSNWTWNRTWLTAGILSYQGSDGLHVDNCTLTNHPGDAIQVGLAPGVLITNNRMSNVAGRGICFAGNVTYQALGSRAAFNYFSSCGTDATSDTSPNGSSHDGQGCITISSYNGDLVIHGNYMTSSISGVGSLNSAGNSNVTITSNDIRSMSSYAIEGLTGLGDYAQNVVIANNRIYSSQSIAITVSGSTATPFPARWIIANNYLSETIVSLSSASNVSVQGNTFVSTTTTATGVNALNSATVNVGSTTGFAASGSFVLGGVATTYTGVTATSFTGCGTHAATVGGEEIGTNLKWFTTSAGGGSTGCSACTVSNNTFVGGSYGINLGSLDSTMTIANNLFQNQSLFGISTGTSTNNILVMGNTYLFGNGVSLNLNAIAVNGAVEVRNNIVDLSTSGNNGIQVGSSAAKARIVGNTIRNISGAKNGIAIAGSAADTELRDNTLTGTYSDGGTRTVKLGNRIANTKASNGQAVLVAGTVTVTTGEVLTGDNIILSVVVPGGTQGFLSVGTIVNKTTFVINSTNAADTSTVYWEIRH